MMRNKTTPLLALIAFEIVAIVGLQFLGTAESMQIRWDELGVLLQTGSIEEIAAPLLRLIALAVAYWLFISTGLFAIAQVSRIPAAIQATSMFTLPSVRRVVDGAIAVSIVTSSFVGLNASTASAQTPTENVITAQAGGDLSVTEETPSAETETGTTGVAPGGDSPAVNSPSSRTVPVTPTSPSEEESSSSSTSSTTSTTVAPSTSAAPSTTVAPSTSASPTTAAPRTAPIAPEAGQQFVPSPRPGAPSTTTTTQAPETPAPAPQTEAPEVLGASEHRVVAGDNLWTISRDALASVTNQKASDLSDSQIREYWLKVIAENRDNLRSGDPHWIFPGEVISLPSSTLPSTG